jgi:hypothetical protein
MKGEIKMADTDFLDMYTDEMLENVLKERKEQKLIQAKLSKPKQRHTKAAFKIILDAAAVVLEHIESDDYNSDNDDDSALSEVVLNAIYGEKIWPWINQNVPD